MNLTDKKFREDITRELFDAYNDNARIAAYWLVQQHDEWKKFATAAVEILGIIMRVFKPSEYKLEYVDEVFDNRTFQWRKAVIK